MTKYGYCFDDWGLYHIDELLEVHEMEENYLHKDAWTCHTFSKEDYYWVKSSRPIFFKAVLKDKKIVFLEECEGPYRKEYVFNTYEEADKYGRENSGLRLY